MVERHAVEDERFTAAALYNLACSSTGVTSILNAATNAVVGEGSLDEGDKCDAFLCNADELDQPLSCPASFKLHQLAKEAVMQRRASRILLFH